MWLFAQINGCSIFSSWFIPWFCLGFNHPFGGAGFLPPTVILKSYSLKRNFIETCWKRNFSILKDYFFWNMLNNFNVMVISIVIPYVSPFCQYVHHSSHLFSLFSHHFSHWNMLKPGKSPPHGRDGTSAIGEITLPFGTIDLHFLIPKKWYR